MSALSTAQFDTVVCRVVDASSEQPVPARLRLLDTSGREVLPIGHPAELAEDAQEGDVRFQSRRYAYVKGEFTLKASDLPVRYQVLKGFEHQIAEGEIAGPATIPMRRWSNLTQSGWYSGDIHIHHIAPETCRLEMEAEDLHVANLLVRDTSRNLLISRHRLVAQALVPTPGSSMPRVSFRFIPAPAPAAPLTPDS